jgi:hypothetical protein
MQGPPRTLSAHCSSFERAIRFNSAVTGPDPAWADPPVVGRGELIQKVLAELQVAPLVVLKGASGVGKSTVLREVCRSIRRSPGVCSTQPTAVRRAQARGVARQIVERVEEALGSGSAEASRYRLGLRGLRLADDDPRAFAYAARDLAADAGVDHIVVAVDDAHRFADGIAWLGDLAESIRRDGDLRLHILLAHTLHEGADLSLQRLPIDCASVFDVGPLDRTDLQHLAKALGLSSAQGAQAWRWSGGRPFDAVQALRDLAFGNGLTLDGAGQAPATLPACDLILLSRLVGFEDPPPMEVLAAACERPQEELEVALLRLETDGELTIEVPTAEGPRRWFHELRRRQLADVLAQKLPAALEAARRASLAAIHDHLIRLAPSDDDPSISEAVDAWLRLAPTQQESRNLLVTVTGTSPFYRHAWDGLLDHLLADDLRGAASRAQAVAAQLREEHFDAPGDDAVLDACLADVALHHLRIVRPELWEAMELCGRPMSGLAGHPRAIAGRFRMLQRHEGEIELGFAEQDTRVGVGDTVSAAPSGVPYGVVTAQSLDRVTISGVSTDVPVPTALVRLPSAGTGIRTDATAAAARDVALHFRDSALAGILRGHPSQWPSSDQSVGSVVSQEGGIMVQFAASARRTHLLVRAVPGGGLIYLTSKAIVAALQAGRSVSVCAMDDFWLEALRERVAIASAEQGYAGPNELCFHRVDRLTSAGEAPRCDLLVVHDGAEVTLADLVVVGRRADALLVTGDSIAALLRDGPDRAGASATVLDHLASTDAGHGVLMLTKTYRMHPDVASFVSRFGFRGELVCDLLTSRSHIGSRGALTGAGLRWLRTAYSEATPAAAEEVTAIATLVDGLLADGVVAHRDAARHRLTGRDILILVPNSVAVRRMAEALPPTVQVTTVREALGLEAEIVVLSLLVRRPRLELGALLAFASRARTLAVLVTAHDILDTFEDLEGTRAHAALAWFLQHAETIETPCP